MTSIDFIKQQLAQFKLVNDELIPAYNFIRENKIWSGFWKHRWIMATLILATLLISTQFIGSFVSGMMSSFSNPESGEIQLNTSALWNSLETLGTGKFMGSGSKYFMLILLEMIIFHCAVQTLNILLGENRQPSFKDFFHAQKRMIKVMIFAWIAEMVLSILISIPLGILSLDFLKTPFIFVVQCFFMGFAFVDNYNEQFDMHLKESRAIIMQHMGATIFIGFVAYCLFLIPIVGSIAGPIFCAVLATLYMYNQGVNLDESRSFEHELIPQN